MVIFLVFFFSLCFFRQQKSGDRQTDRQRDRDRDTDRLQLSITPRHKETSKHRKREIRIKHLKGIKRRKCKNCKQRQQNRQQTQTHVSTSDIPGLKYTWEWNQGMAEKPLSGCGQGDNVARCTYDAPVLCKPALKLVLGHAGLKKRQTQTR